MWYRDPAENDRVLQLNVAAFLSNLVPAFSPESTEDLPTAHLDSIHTPYTRYNSGRP